MPPTARRLLTPHALAVAVTLAAPGAASAKRPGARTITRAELPSGARIVVVRDARAPRVAARAAWAGGLHFEAPGERGITRLLAATFARACGAMGPVELEVRAERSDVTMSGVAGRSVFEVRADWRTSAWDAGFALLATCLLRPRFEPADVERQRRRLIRELAAGQQRPGVVAHETFLAALHPNRRHWGPRTGTAASLWRITPQRLQAHYRDNYRLDGLTLVVVGNVEPERVLARARRQLGEGVRGGRPSARAGNAEIPDSIRDGSTKRDLFRYLDHPEAHLVLGFPGLPWDDPDRFALDVLTEVLAGRFNAVDGDSPVCDRAGVACASASDSGYLAVYLACRPGDLPRAVEGIRRQLQLVTQEEVSVLEVERAAEQLAAAHGASLEVASSVAAGMAFHDVHRLDSSGYLEYAARVRTVTPADVARVARRVVNWDRAVTATVMPPAWTPGVLERARGVRRRARRRR